MSSKFYGDAIWTTHALKRLAQRGLSQKLAWTAFQYPETSTKLDGNGTMEYKKSFGDSVVTIIAKKNDQRKWVIISCWVDPPISGSIDSKRHNWYLKYRQSGFWGKVLMRFFEALTGRNY